MSRQTRSRAQPCGSPRPPRAMPPGGFDRHHQAWSEIAGFGHALPAAARRAGRRSWRRTRSAPCPRRRRPAAGRRPDPCRARWRHSSPRPPPPQRAEGLRLGLQQFHLHGQLSGFMERSAWDRRGLSEASIPPIAFGHATASRKISTPNWRDRSCTGASRKSRRTTSRSRHRPSLAKSQRACRQSLAWGKRGRAKLARVTTGPATATFFSKLSVMFRSSLDTSANSVSKEIGSDSVRTLYHRALTHVGDSQGSDL